MLFDCRHKDSRFMQATELSNASLIRGVDIIYIHSVPRPHQAE